MLKTTRARLTRPALPELLWSLLRALQLILALTAIGIYGRDLHRASSAHEHADSRWVYAAVVGGLSCLCAVAALAVPALRRRTWAWWWPVDGVLFFLWLVLFAVFARLYLGEDCEGSGACGRMKAGVWVDLVAMVAWFVAFVAGAFCFWRERHSRSIFTGRAAVV